MRLWGAYSLRTHLIAFGVIILIPVTVLAGVLLIRSAIYERTELESRLAQVADDLAFDVDREVDRQLTVLKTLATLPALQAGDWRMFYDQAKAAVGEDAYVVLIDTSLRQLVNTFVPYGQAPQTTGDPETARRMIASKQPDVSDMFVSLVTKRPVYNVNIPIIRDGEVRYILHLGQLTERLLPILQGQQVRPEWTLLILDRKGAVLARSRDHEKFAGTTPALYAADTRIDRGFRKTMSLDGQNVLRAMTRGRTSGWLASASIPVALAEAPLWRSLQLWGAIATFALLLTIAIGWLMGRALARPMAVVAEAAAALGREEKVLSVRSSLSEANTIMTALADASTELKKRASAQQVLSSELSHRVKNVLSVVQTLSKHTLSNHHSIADARHALSERIQALGRAHDQLFNTEWKVVSLKEIVDAELAPFPDRVQIDGPHVDIDGKRVQTLHLVLHELATNAIKYGALSNQNGKVLVTWSIAGAGSDARLKFRWEEKDGPEVKPPAPDRKGFGRMLLTNAFSGIEAEPRFTFGPGGLVYEFDASLDTMAGKF